MLRARCWTTLDLPATTLPSASCVIGTICNHRDNHHSSTVHRFFIRLEKKESLPVISSIGEDVQFTTEGNMVEIGTTACAVLGLLSFVHVLDRASCRKPDSNDVIHMSDADKNITSTDAGVISDVENVTAEIANYCESFASTETGENLTWPGASVGSTVDVVQQESICGIKVLRDCLEGGQWSDIHTREPEECLADKILRILVFIGFSVSLIACTVAFVVFMITRSSLRGGYYQYHIHWNLITSFILYPVVLLVSIHVFSTQFVQENTWLRNLLTVLLAYFVLANFFWMLVEGLVLFVLVATSFPGPQRGRAFVKWCLIGWGIPAILVTAWIIVEKVITPADRKFILHIEKTEAANYACLIGPTCAALLINCFVLVVVMRILWRKLQVDARNNVEHQHQRSSWRAAKSTFVILILLGVYYALPIIVFAFEPPLRLQYVVHYVSNLVNALQGLAVCMLYVFCNAEVKRALRNWRRRLDNTTGLTFITRLPPPSSSSRSATPRHSKSHSSSEGSSGKRPSTEIEMALAADETQTKRQICVIVESLVEDPSENGLDEHGPIAHV